MNSYEVWQEVTTGDIVFAKSEAGKRDSGAWTEIGMVIRPSDVGVPQVRSPIVFTVEGTIGEVLPTVRALGHNELGIVQYHAGKRQDWLAHLRSAAMSVPVVGVDAAGATVLGVLRRHKPSRAEVVDPHLGFRRLLEATGRGGPENTQMRCPFDGNLCPCPIHD